MHILRAFLRPTRLKLLFLLEWTIFILIELCRGRLRTGHDFLVAGYPLLFFYLIGCIMAAPAGRAYRPPRWRYLLGLAVWLVIAEQAVKAAVGAFIPWKASVPLLPGWLQLAHVRNMRGTWLLNELNVDWVGIGLLIAGLIILLSCFVMGCLYYAARQRRSRWMDAAFVFITAGIGGALADLVFRRYILDFINLPGITTADLKDIFLTLGLASLFAELLENGMLSWRWLGWRRELDDTRRLIGDFVAFLRKETRQIFRKGRLLH